eukprot:scaffold1693_cov109-Isochrysis_galbana.AAC.2
MSMCHPSVLTSNTNTVTTPMVTCTCYFYYYPFTWRCLGQNPKERRETIRRQPRQQPAAQCAEQCRSMQLCSATDTGPPQKLCANSGSWRRRQQLLRI